MSNIIFISGTPCTGKTTISEKLSEKLNYDLIKINDLAIDNNLVLGIDDDKGYKIIDIDGLNELLLEIIPEHDNLIVEGHLSHLCSGADKLIVLRCRPEILEKRLALRNYSDAKIHENLEAEALGVCSAEGLEIYENNIYELDVSDLSVDEVVLTLMDVINDEKELSFGEIDFMEWLLAHQ
ncbi:MAG: adenylate kinase family protein [Methanobrevibacter sp.]|uniref:adenylate kinase family protein n=1 Tax=Methanobrevibacter sp. TaxID=66852 RepID=UPI0025E2B110|nr:adenylate kinase family protein [Methanobrevibacter sp.]MBR0271283.1 adenylate kinase family protein [Methanobrevibacter sp.]